MEKYKEPLQKLLSYLEKYNGKRFESIYSIIAYEWFTLEEKFSLFEFFCNNYDLDSVQYRLLVKDHTYSISLVKTAIKSL